ncbi:MAG: MFS transporter, partial [Mycobacteriales bacterium]
TSASAGRLPRDFWLYFTGQAASTLGSSFTQFALPLLIFALTGSAANLGAAMATSFAPYLLFGLVIGAVSDRLDRKRMMIGTDLVRAALIALIPALSVAGVLHVGWIYAVAFLQSTARIFFDAGEFAAIPSLVAKDRLVTANGRIQASFSAAGIVGPVLAGVLVSVAPIADVLLVDAATFALSAGSLALIRRSFNEVPAAQHPGAGQRGRALLRALRAEIGEGLRYVWGHPVLRTISIMMAIVNLFSSTAFAQLVFYAKRHLAASNGELGYLYAAGGVGVVLISLLAGPLRRRFRFSTVALTALVLDGLAVIGMGLTSTYAIAIVLWAINNGVGVLFNINTQSLRQEIVPNRLLGRVMSLAGVLAWSAIPVGSLIGGFAVARYGVGAVFVVIGVVSVVVAVGFRWSPLGSAQRYLPGGDREVRDERAAPVAP